MRRVMPAAARHRAIGSTPVTGRTRPVERKLSEKGEPVQSERRVFRPQHAMAMARSEPVPSLGSSAGARLTVTPTLRKLEARVADRRFDPLAGLLDGPIP